MNSSGKVKQVLNNISLSNEEFLEFKEWMITQIDRNKNIINSNPEYYDGKVSGIKDCLDYFWEKAIKTVDEENKNIPKP